LFICLFLSLRPAQDLGHRLHAQITAERALAEKRAGDVRRELSAESAARESADARLRALVTEETSEIKRASQREAAERAQADGELANALTVATDALQSGIRIATLQ